MIDQGPVVRHRSSANVDLAETGRSRGAGASLALGVWETGTTAFMSDRDISLSVVLDDRGERGTPR